MYLSATAAKAQCCLKCDFLGGGQFFFFLAKTFLEIIMEVNEKMEFAI